MHVERQHHGMPLIRADPVEILGKLGIGEADRPALDAHMANTIPAGRYGRPEELARAALLLASNDFVNGVELHVDGGMSLV